MKLSLDDKFDDFYRSASLGSDPDMEKFARALFYAGAGSVFYSLLPPAEWTQCIKDTGDQIQTYRDSLSKYRKPQ